MVEKQFVKAHIVETINEFLINGGKITILESIKAPDITYYPMVQHKGQYIPGWPSGCYRVPSLGRD